MERAGRRTLQPPRDGLHKRDEDARAGEDAQRGDEVVAVALGEALAAEVGARGLAVVRHALAACRRAISARRCKGPETGEERNALATTRSRFSSLTWHTATLKASMPLRTKYFGHVPPRFETVLRSCGA